MKVIIQRVQRGEVSVAGEAIGAIGTGFVVLFGARTGDRAEDAIQLARKTASLRIFPDDQERMNRSLQDLRGEALVISQFTLYADTQKGNRPSFLDAAPPAEAEQLYDTYVDALRQILGPDRVATGRFGARMLVTILNDGPVTVELSTDR